MIKLIITLSIPLVKDSPTINAARKQLFLKYRDSGKIVADFIYINDTTFELRFNSLESAQEFEQEFSSLNENTATFEYL